MYCMMADQFMASLHMQASSGSAKLWLQMNEGTVEAVQKHLVTACTGLSKLAQAWPKC